MDAKELKSQQAYDAYMEGDFEAAFDLWHELAKDGEALAQNNLSALYDAGDGVEQDSHQAYEWALQAAKNGNQAALGALGRKLIRGEGVEIDIEKGIDCLLSAAQGGDPRSMTALGAIYSLGKIRPKDLKIAAQWMQEAAEHEEPLAQLILGNMFDHGMGVLQSREESTKWFLRASENGNIPAMYPAGARMVDGDGLTQNVPLGMEYLLAAARGGITHAMRKLGDVYSKGLVVEQDLIEAVQWYERAADLDNVEAQFQLGLLYTQRREGGNALLNIPRGVFWLERAVEQGDLDSIAFLAIVLFNDTGVYADKPRAMELIKQGVEKGGELCMYFLGKSYLSGQNVPMDKARGIELLNQASNEGSLLARSYLCMLKIDGVEDLLEPDPDAAIEELKQCEGEIDREAAYTAGVHFYDDPAHREDAIFWLKQAAEADYEPVYFFLGVLQLKSDTSEVIREGIQWLEKASPNVGGRAEFNLSQLYLDGGKVEQDYEKAWHWANFSKELGCEFGALYVALILFDSDSGHYDPKLGMQFATELADTGLHNAMALIANAHERGLGVPVNLELALDWYASAAEAGSDDCARILGFKYFQGDGVVESRAQAVKWLTPIAQADDLRSMCCLMMAHGEDKEIPEDMVLAYTYIALAGPYVKGLQKEMVDMLEPDFKKQISEEELKMAEIQADEWRSREGFLPH